jgi:proteasome accessory factor A
MSELPKRITGLEMEWSVFNHDAPADDITSIVTKRVMRYHADPAIRSSTMNGSNGFLGNGSRLYVDVGSHPEYATPEDTSFLGTAANEIAGERILHGIFTQEDPQEAESPRLSIIKRLASDNGNTCGNHENYCVDITKGIEVNSSGLALLGVHMATRTILSGAGMVQKNGEFSLAQKSLSLDDDFGSGTTGKSKPLVNLRPEHLADAKKWNRVHITSGDANMSPWAIRMKLGTTSLVLRLLEESDDPLPDLRFVRPLRFIARSVALDTGLGERHRLVNGTSVTAIETQKMLITAAKRLANQNSFSLPEEELWTIEQWEKACCDLEQDPELLSDRVDWVARRRMLDKISTRKGISWDSDAMHSYDISWDQIDENTGLGMIARDRFFSKWMPSEQLITQRKSTAPDTTRARQRGKIIKTVEATDIRGIDWNKVALTGQTIIELDSPYETHNLQAINALRRYKASRNAKKPAA